jgi:hypothetical protein
MVELNEVTKNESRNKGEKKRTRNGPQAIFHFRNTMNQMNFMSSSEALTTMFDVF